VGRSAPERVEQFRQVCAPWLAAAFPIPSPDDPSDDRLDEFRSNLAYVDAMVADGAIPFLSGEVDAQALQVPDQARNELESVIAATAGFANDASSLAGRILGYAMLLATVLNAADQMRSAEPGAMA
jgi:hypothetical protein